MKFKQKVLRWCRYLMLALLSFVMAVPFLWMVSTSLKTLDQVYVFPLQLIPDTFHWENYIEIWKLAPLSRYFLNSLFMAGVISILQLLFMVPAAYAFARMEFKGKNILFLLVLATMMIPQQVSFIPNFLMVKQLGWLDTYMGIIAPFSVRAFGIFMLRQAFMQIPKELEEAALLEGCGHIRMMSHFMIPLSKSAIVTYSLLSFIWNYNEFFWPLIVTNDESMRTIQLGLRSFLTQGGAGGGGTQWHLVMAAATVVIAPLIVLFVSMQKFIMKGVATTGIK